MIKQITALDDEDFEKIKESLTGLRSAAHNLDESDIKDQLILTIDDIENTLGIETPEIPKVVTAKWSVWYNAMFNSRTLRCGGCGYRHDMAFHTSDDASDIPRVCPQCKAVMTGVE